MSYEPWKEERAAQLEKYSRRGITPAPEGQVWVCGACGKKSRTKYGFDADGNRTNIDHGWDESCMMNAVLCFDPTVPTSTTDGTRAA